MPRPTVALLVVLVLLSGCAPAAIGTLDYRTERPSLRGRRLLVLVPPSSPGEGRGRADTVRVREFVPLAAIGKPSYARVPVDTLVAALRASGAWASVAVREGPQAVALTSGSYRIIRTRPGFGDPTYSRATLTVPAAPAAGAFGPDVDAVLIVTDAGLAFGRARLRPSGIPSVGRSGVPGMGATFTQGDDSIIARATLTLWDDEAAAVVGHGVVEGAAPIRSRLFSSAESRSPQGLARESQVAFVEAVAEDVPLLGIPEPGRR